MACPVCGGETPPDGSAPCPRCAHPAVAEEAARSLLEAGDLLQAGRLDRAVQRIQHAIKTAPASYIPHLRLAAAYERKAQDGQEVFLRLAEREAEEAVRLAPAERAAHEGRLSIAAKRGRLAALRAEYDLRRQELPFAEECLRMIAAMERIGTTRETLSAGLGSGKTKSRYFFLGAGGAALLGLIPLVAVVHRSMDESYAMLGSMDFYACAGLFTGAGILALEGYRALKGIGG